VISINYYVVFLILNWPLQCFLFIFILSITIELCILTVRYHLLTNIFNSGYKFYYPCSRVFLITDTVRTLAVGYFLLQIQYVPLQWGISYYRYSTYPCSGVFLITDTVRTLAVGYFLLQIQYVPLQWGISYYEYCILAVGLYQGRLNGPSDLQM